MITMVIIVIIINYNNKNDNNNSNDSNNSNNGTASRIATFSAPRSFDKTSEAKARADSLRFRNVFPWNSPCG